MSALPAILAVASLWFSIIATILFVLGRLSDRRDDLDDIARTAAAYEALARCRRDCTCRGDG